MKLIDEEGNEVEFDGVLTGLIQPGYLSVLDRSRPYDGQTHTNLGERGKQEIHGLTMRDLRDCFIRACYDASGLSVEDYPKDVFGLPWDEMDPIAIAQGLTCWVEKYMGIYPNLPELHRVDDG